MGANLTFRQRLRRTLAKGVPDRVPMVDIPHWPETLERWRREGLPEGVHPGGCFGWGPMRRFPSVREVFKIPERNEWDDGLLSESSAGTIR